MGRLSGRSRRREDGFTLVEAMIAMVITGILASAMVSLLIGQSSFYERTDDQIWAEQSLRATFDLVSSEVRMASAADVLAAEEDSVTLRFDYLRAIVCDSTAADEAALMAFDTILNANLTALTGTAYSGPYETDYEYADGFVPTQTAVGTAPKAVCTANGTTASGPDNAYASMTGWSSQFTDGVPDRGSIVRLYGTLTYRFAPSAFFRSRRALWRGTQEMVGPFEENAAFSYVMDDGSVESSVSSGDLDEIVAVRISATALPDGANRFGVERTLEFDIPFRN
jgi:prepilin-type N-terminal cleavage/methylation domain-containing protein